MNQNGQTAASAAATSTTKRNKNRSSGISSNAPSSMSSNVQRYYPFRFMIIY